MRPRLPRNLQLPLWEVVSEARHNTLFSCTYLALTCDSAIVLFFAFDLNG